VPESVLVAGFTGTRFGMTFRQQRELKEQLWAYRSLHHGDAIGSDAQCHRIAQGMGQFRITIHPPSNPSQRAWCIGDVLKPPKDYGKRDCNIVDACDTLFATPRFMVEELRSGTWQTIRYARKRKKHIRIIWPDGSIREENA
jgi:hypothetical protein